MHLLLTYNLTCMYVHGFNVLRRSVESGHLTFRIEYLAVKRNEVVIYKLETTR